MKHLLRSLTLLAIFLPAGHAAFADTISFSGAATIEPTDISFVGEQSVSVTGTGSLSDFVAGHNTEFKTTFTFAGIGGSGGETLFTEQNLADEVKVKFTVTSYTYDASTGVYTFFGIITVTSTAPGGGVISSSGAVGIFTPDGNNNTFTMALTTTPEPGSLLLLATGLASSAGILYRKRRPVV